MYDNESGLHIKSTQVVSSETMRVYVLCVAKAGSEVPPYEWMSNTEPELSQYLRSQVILYEEREESEGKRPSSADTLGDIIGLSAAARTQKDYDRAGKLSSDDELFNCSETLHNT